MAAKLVWYNSPKTADGWAPEFLIRQNMFNSSQLNVTPAPGYSSGQVMNALEEVFAQTMPSGMGYD